jgi:hypothetical protein
VILEYIPYRRMMIRPSPTVISISRSMVISVRGWIAAVPAPVKASTSTGRFPWKIVRSDSITIVNVCCTLRSSETSFHVIIGLEIKVNDVLHHQQRWVRSFPRQLL